MRATLARLAGALMLTLIVVSATPVTAQDDPGAAPAPTSEVVVLVQRTAADGSAEVIANETVRLHVVVPPHDVLRTLSERTDARGIARFAVTPRDGAEVVAEFDSGRRYFSDSVEISSAGRHSVTIAVYGETTDPSVVKATSVQTIVEPWENYVAVTQVWNLTTSEPVLYRPDPDDPSTFLRLPMPAGAEGIRVIRPEESSRVIGTLVAFAAEVSPADAADTGESHVVIQFSLKSNNLAEVSWDQALPMDVDEFTVIVPQESNHARHPVLDVTIDGPRCAEGAAGFCFESFDTDTSGLQLREDVPMRVARGTGLGGQIVSVTTRGWPSRRDWPKQAAIGASAFALFFVIALFVRDRRMRSDDASELRRQALESRKASLFEAAAELDRRLDDGLVLQHDHDLASERIRQQLGVVYRRIREMDEGMTDEATEA